MNCWGFTPVIFPQLEASLRRFVTERGADPKSEFYLPAAVAAGLITGGTARSGGAAHRSQLVRRHLPRGQAAGNGGDRTIPWSPPKATLGPPFLNFMSTLTFARLPDADIFVPGAAMPPPPWPGPRTYA